MQKANKQHSAEKLGLSEHPASKSRQNASMSVFVICFLLLKKKVSKTDLIGINSDPGLPINKKAVFTSR